MQKQALGKGLGALIPDLSSLDDKARKALGIHEIELDKIVPNEYQPRKTFQNGEPERACRLDKRARGDPTRHRPPDRDELWPHCR